MFYNNKLSIDKGKGMYYNTPVLDEMLGSKAGEEDSPNLYDTLADVHTQAPHIYMLSSGGLYE